MSISVEKQLYALIDAFESGAMPFDDFSRKFSDTYLDGADDLPDSETTRMFDAIHERLEWTTTSPPEEDRAYGWGDPADFQAWLLSIRRGVQAVE